MRRAIPLIGVGILLLAACGPSGNGNSESDDGRTEIDFWHAMSGGRGDVVDKLVSDYNESQDEYQINPEFTGTYADTLSKATAAVRADEPPAIAQIYEVGFKTMHDSGVTVPPYEMAPDDFDWNKFVDPIRDYYSVDDKLQCMPFNSSTAMLYYNKDLFEEAGLDPDQPPETFEDVHEMGQQILDETDAQGGISFGWPAWIFEQTHALHNQLYVNDANGRDANATEVLFDEDFGTEVLDEWKTWYDDGVLEYGGREYEANDPFLAGEFGMLAQSTSSLAGITDGADFDVGTAFLPELPEYSDDGGGSVIGGGCLWTFDGLDDDVYDGVWEFFDFLQETDNSVYWHKNTGYFPTTTEAYESLQDEGWFDDNPTFSTAFDQILESGNSPAALGSQIGPFVDIRDVVGAGLEDALTQGKDARQTLDDTATESNDLLVGYREQQEG